MKTEFKINVLEDGVTHINCFSRGFTEIGKLLTNFAETPFEIKPFGRFSSIEGFWMWLGTGKQYNDFRKLSGYSAKSAGRRYERVNVPDFNAYIKLAILCKLDQTPGLIEKLIATGKLPLVHYYYYGDPNNNPHIVRPTQHEWIMSFLMKVRHSLQERKEKYGYVPNVSDHIRCYSDIVRNLMEV